MNLSLAIFHDEETAKEWGWVQVRWEDAMELNTLRDHHCVVESTSVSGKYDMEQGSTGVCKRRRCMPSR